MQYKCFLSFTQKSSNQNAAANLYDVSFHEHKAVDSPRPTSTCIDVTAIALPSVFVQPLSPPSFLHIHNLFRNRIHVSVGHNSSLTVLQAVLLLALLFFFFFYPVKTYASDHYAAFPCQIRITQPPRSKIAHASKRPSS